MQNDDMGLTGGEEVFEVRDSEREAVSAEVVAVPGSEVVERTDEGYGVWKEFFTLYPEADAASLPDEVYRDVRTGLSPTAAYERHQSRMLRAELEVVKHLRRNDETALGALGPGYAAGPRDAFMGGFEEAFKER